MLMVNGRDRIQRQVYLIFINGAFITMFHCLMIRSTATRQTNCNKPFYLFLIFSHTFKIIPVGRKGWELLLKGKIIKIYCTPCHPGNSFGRSSQLPTITAGIRIIYLISIQNSIFSPQGDWVSKDIWNNLRFLIFSYHSNFSLK